MEIPRSGIVNRYIATQGPLATTCEEFWQMVWEQKCSLIVMVTPLKERGRIKCHKYWPEIGETETCNHLSITTVKEEGNEAMIEREFKLINNLENEERDIIHLQYLAWPDHGVPDEANDFLDLIFKVRHYRSGLVDPIIVHCR
jgi:tyrosine-protein phosphatase non-receptor type 4